MTGLQNKVAVISGGSGGIGSAVVLRLTEANHIAVVLDRDEAGGQKLLNGVRSKDYKGEFFALDLTQKSEVQATFTKVASRFRTIDVLVNLAGGTLHRKLMQDFSLREWQEVIDANLRSTFLCCQAVIPIMKGQNGGVIINTSSNYGITGSAMRAPYAAAKAGIIAFTKSLALELAPFRIRTNTIAPGRTATARVMSNHTEKEWAAMGKQIPMGRAAEPREVAEGVAFLASQEAAYMTGQTLHVNGGMIMA